MSSLVIASQLFVDDVVLLVSSSCGLIQLLGAAECQAAKMRVNGMALCWKKVDCPLQVESEFLPHVKEFTFLRILSEGRMKREIGRLEGEALVHLRCSPHIWS